MPTRNKSKAAVALDAAAQTFLPNASIVEVVESFAISRSTLTYARLIHQYGTPEEIQKVRDGEIGLRPLGEKLRAGLPNEARRVLTRRTTWTQRRRENLQTEAALYAKFGPVLRSLTELPNPKDMVKLVKSNTSREQGVAQYLEAALKWLKEFEYEWGKYREFKSSEDPTDT